MFGITMYVPPHYHNYEIIIVHLFIIVYFKERISLPTPKFVHEFCKSVFECFFDHKHNWVHCG